ncbi:c-type cytochrome biogenesis protein CcsB [Geopsychrobacter electrodiphilus]|uniref:c-type cytochrome biogenesis protein CcsB n=1 Tax=Geopsychrobacter electrodiphilus TaxID=225196 RepID=UPI000381D912|nr:c-type cytochrome biogenesis protein CcsB [Geopsychrobacter electrodiphilus]
MSSHIILFKTVILCYLIATVLYLLHVVGRKEKPGQFARWFLLAGALIQMVGFIVEFVRIGHTPVTDLHESLAFFAWCLVAIFLFFDLRYRLSVMGAFSSVLAVITMLGSGISPKVVEPLNPALNSWWFPVHVTFAFLGNAAFALAFGAGIMYLLQDRMLKSKRFSTLYYRLPSLDTLDNINYRALSYGFPLMTLGIISGAAWAESVWGTYWSWDPKQTWALMTWFVYAALLHGRLSIGWRGRRAAIFAIIGFACLVFTFLGVNLLLNGMHTFDALMGKP